MTNPRDRKSVWHRGCARSGWRRVWNTDARPRRRSRPSRRSCLGGRGAARPRRISGTLGPGRLARPSSMSNAAHALRICVRGHSSVGAFIDSNNETLMVPANGWREALRDLVGIPPETETEALLRENNELLKQLIVEVRKILREMETMNEMTDRKSVV